MFILARLVLSVILIFAPNLTRESQNKYHYKVLAQAVDETGRPVPYAYALIAPEQDNLGGDFMYSVQADALGRLRFELEDSNLAKGTRLLYVTGPMPPNAVTYITPPFNEYPAFAGSTRSKRRILIRKNGDADLGKIPINVSYGVVRVFLQDRLGKPLIMDVGGWEKVVLRIRNERGQFMEEKGISTERIEKAVDLSRSSIAIGLPQGTWRIEVSLNDQSPWVKSPPTITRGSSTIDLILKTR